MRHSNHERKLISIYSLSNLHVIYIRELAGQMAHLVRRSISLASLYAAQELRLHDQLQTFACNTQAHKLFKLTRNLIILAYLDIGTGIISIRVKVARI